MHKFALEGKFLPCLLQAEMARVKQLNKTCQLQGASVKLGSANKFAS